MVVFTSDHGEMLGERGMWFKQSFFESSVRVPLIARLPKNTSGRVRELVSLIDLLPTFMEIATGDQPQAPATSLDGRSLVGLMSGGGAWQNQVISEYTGEGVVAPCRMVRRDNYKYIYTHGHPPLMFDLDSDPLELMNLIGRPETRKVENALAAAILDGWDPEEIAARCIQSQKERMLIQKVTDGDPTWAYLYRGGDAGRYIRNASAVGTKARARYPFVEPTPFLNGPPDPSPS